MHKPLCMIYGITDISLQTNKHNFQKQQGVAKKTLLFVCWCVHVHQLLNILTEPFTIFQ